jgi:hypothetical protein
MGSRTREMGTDPGNIQRSQMDLSPCISTYPQPEGASRRLTVLSFPALRAFADGFGGALIGGFMYYLVLAYFHPDALEFAWLRVLAVSLIFGGFEMWRVARRPTLRSIKTCMLWTLTVSLFVLGPLREIIFYADGSPYRAGPSSIKAAAR